MTVYDLMTLITTKIGSGELDGNKPVLFNDNEELILTVDERQLVIESVEPAAEVEKSPKKKKGWFGNAKKG
jgi:hypothetical protein